jgi:hypothetical protein
LEWVLRIRGSALIVVLYNSGHQVGNMKEVRPGYRGKHAVFVGQDVAKCYSDLGTEKDIAWLHLTLSVSAQVWPDEVSVMQHIRNNVVFGQGLRSEALQIVL